MQNNEIEISEDELIAILQDGANSARCGIYLHNIIPLLRWQIYHNIEFERLNQKFGELSMLYSKYNLGWNGVTYLKMLDTLADKYNRKCYNYIANLVTYRMIRDCESLREAELLLISATGLIETLKPDDFLIEARLEGQELMKRYNIKPLKPSLWSLQRVTPNLHPIVRMSQVAHLIYRKAHLFDIILQITNRDDILFYFGVEASPKWSRYFSKNASLRIGADKCDSFGINLIVPLLNAYGLQSDDDRLCEIASDLNESLPPEHNILVSKWRNHGLTPTCSFETQALIHLSKVYCKERRCTQCHVFQHIRYNIKLALQIPHFLK